MMVECDNCRREISYNARICPHCGHRYPSVRWTVALLVGVLLILFAVTVVTIW